MCQLMHDRLATILHLQLSQQHMLASLTGDNYSLSSWFLELVLAHFSTAVSTVT